MGGVQSYMSWKTRGMRPPEEQSDFKGLISNDLAAGFGAFRADGRCGRGLGAGSSFAPADGGLQSLIEE